MADQPGFSVTVRGMLLGAHLRRLREAVGLDREDAGWEIRSSETAFERMERGLRPFKERDVADLLTLYGVSGVEGVRERERVLDMTRTAHVRDWRVRQRDISSEWQQTYLAFESAATTVRGFDGRFVPRLLQTEQYAEAAIRVSEPDVARAEMDRRLRMLLNQQATLLADQPLQLWLVIDESVLHRPVGGSHVLRDQIEALFDATKLPTIRLQILPTRAGEYVNPLGSFTMLGFPEPDLPEVVVLHEFTCLVYLDNPDDIRRYGSLFERLRLEAEPFESTTDVLERALWSIEKEAEAAPSSMARDRVTRPCLYDPSAVDIARADLLGNSVYEAKRLARAGETLVAWFGNDATTENGEHDAPYATAPTVSTEVYLSTNDIETAYRVYAAVDDLAELLGYDGPIDQEFHRGSIWRRAKAVLKGAATSEELRVRLLKMERALELHGIESRQAEVNVTHSQAITNLLAALDGVPSACVRVGSILLAKFDDGNGAVVLTRSLSQMEVRMLERFPEIQKEPREVLNALAMALATAPDEPTQCGP